VQLDDGSTQYVSAAVGTTGWIHTQQGRRERDSDDGGARILVKTEVATARCGVGVARAAGLGWHRPANKRWRRRLDFLSDLALYSAAICWRLGEQSTGVHKSSSTPRTVKKRTRVAACSPSASSLSTSEPNLAPRARVTHGWSTAPKGRAGGRGKGGEGGVPWRPCPRSRAAYPWGWGQSCRPKRHAGFFVLHSYLSATSWHLRHVCGILRACSEGNGTAESGFQYFLDWWGGGKRSSAGCGCGSLSPRASNETGVERTVHGRCSGCHMDG